MSVLAYEMMAPLIVPTALAMVGAAGGAGYSLTSALQSAVGEKKLKKLPLVNNARFVQVAEALSAIFGAASLVATSSAACLRHVLLSPRGAPEFLRPMVDYLPTCIVGGIACGFFAGALYKASQNRSAILGNRA